MIRINLLPIKTTIQKETSKRQLILFAILILVQMGVFFFVYGQKAGKLDDLQEKNRTKAATIEQLKKQVADVEKLTKEKGLLEEQIGVLDLLEIGRAGPVRVMDEILLILSTPKNDLGKLTFDKRGWNAKWDPSRLWFNTLQEKGGLFKLSGGAHSTDDVAEFLQRLSTSVYFEDIRLIATEQTEEKKFKFVKFQLTGKISYSLGAGLAQPKKGK